MEYLNIELNKAIEEKSKRRQTLPHDGLTNEQWLDREAKRQIGRQMAAERYLRTNYDEEVF